jgi:hypothetical protein
MGLEKKGRKGKSKVRDHKDRGWEGSGGAETGGEKKQSLKRLHSAQSATTL